jgi:hypothetical protein
MRQWNTASSERSPLPSAAKSWPSAAIAAIPRGDLPFVTERKPMPKGRWLRYSRIYGMPNILGALALERRTISAKIAAT